MKFFLILITALISCVFFISGNDPMPTVMCGYLGKTLGASSFSFIKSDVPDRCNAILYSVFFFDLPMVEDDKNAIKQLVSDGKKVFVLASYKNARQWPTIMNAPDKETYSQLTAPLITFIKEHKIHGIFMDMLDLFDGNVTDYPLKLNTFVCRIKEDIPSLQVGIVLNGFDCNFYVSFDYTVTNDNVDIYLVETSTIVYECTKKNLKAPRFAKTSPDKPIATVNCITTGISLSSFNKKKLMLMTFIGPQIVDEISSSYTLFCSQSSTDNQSWCIDTTKEIKELVTSIKGSFNGILVGNLDDDDFKNTCECGLYPIANAYIDAWESKTTNSCAKIDNYK